MKGSMCSLAFAIALLSVVAPASSTKTMQSSQAQVTPVAKVVSMLEDMILKAKEAKKTEEVEFAAFKQWCDNVRSEKTKNIASQASEIEQLDADIETASSDAALLAEEVGTLEATIDELKAQAANATSVRKNERTDYEATHKDFSESIDACKRAVQVLKAKTADVPQSLLQLQRSLSLSPHEQSLIDAFLGTSQAPEANAYEFQSSSVIDILEKLTAKFKSEKLALEKAELAARSNYEVLMQRLTDNLKASKASSSAKTAAKAGRLEDAASAKGDLSLVEKAKSEDEETLAGTVAQCHAKSEEYEKNQVLRAGEIEALSKAVDILTDSTVKGHAETYLPSLLQSAHRGMSFAQLQKSKSPPEPARPRAATAEYLQVQAAKLGSHYLSVVAARVSEDPFGKVKKLIKDLITKLMEQANEEADQHAYCQTELATNKQTRENKNAEVEELTAKVDSLTSESEQLSADITKLSDSISEMKGEEAEATKLRGEEKATNTKTVADAKEAQVAVEQAIQVIREFYSKAAESASLLEIHANDVRQKEPYTGLQDESGGVLGMLDVILADFARLESETSSAEDQAAAAYTKFMADSTQDVEVKTTEMKHAEGKKAQVTETLGETKKVLELTQEELTTALDYYAKLKADCVDEGLSYAERKQRREEEIASLQEALKMLNGEDLSA